MAAMAWRPGVNTDSAGILRDIAIDERVHVLAPRRTATRAESRARDQALESSYERGLADGHARATELARQEADRAVAERVREEVGAALAELNEAARQEGRDAGLALARELLEESQAATRARADALLANLAVSARGWARTAEEELVLLAHEIASRVIAETAVRPEAIRLLARRLLQDVAGDCSEVLHVHVHPDDLAALTSAETRDGWRWVADPSIATGGVCLRSPRGSFDARLETQFAALGELLREARRHRAEGTS
jgi:flagellar biosynthesis/type III secretory pathway protein FliH